jgi:hypothetical protein
VAPAVASSGFSLIRMSPLELRPIELEEVPSIVHLIQRAIARLPAAL